VVEKGYVAGGNTRRNTTTIRSKYLTAESICFFKNGVKPFEEMPQELGFNVMFSQRPQITLGHSKATEQSLRLRAEMGNLAGARIEVVDLKTMRDICPFLTMDEGDQLEVVGDRWHADGGTARQEAVVRGYAKRAAERRVEIHQRTALIGMAIQIDRVLATHAGSGTIRAGQVNQAAGGLNGQVAELAGMSLPLRCFPLQSMVTHAVKSFTGIIRDLTHVSRAILPWRDCDRRRFRFLPACFHAIDLRAKRTIGRKGLYLFPFLRNVKLLRQWAGITDMTPDYSPIMGVSRPSNCWLNTGCWTWGFKVTPDVGKHQAECVATGENPSLLEPLSLSCFERCELLNEMGTTAASH
jgi:sarcosine oxidase subunit beta